HSGQSVKDRRLLTSFSSLIPASVMLLAFQRFSLCKNLRFLSCFSPASVTFWLAPRSTPITCHAPDASSRVTLPPPLTRARAALSAAGSACSAAPARIGTNATIKRFDCRCFMAVLAGVEFLCGPRLQRVACQVLVPGLDRQARGPPPALRPATGV